MGAHRCGVTRQSDKVHENNPFSSVEDHETRQVVQTIDTSQSNTVTIYRDEDGTFKIDDESWELIFFHAN